jgi:hypothetical protein
VLVYWPAAHAVQLLAPVPFPVFVREPALHAMQLVWFVLSWYLPATHGAHALVEGELDWPAGQVVQLVAPPAWQNTEFVWFPDQSTPGSVWGFEEKSYVLKAAQKYPE